MNSKTLKVCIAAVILCISGYFLLLKPSDNQENIETDSVNTTASKELIKSEEVSDSHLIPKPIATPTKNSAPMKTLAAEAHQEAAADDNTALGDSFWSASEAARDYFENSDELPVDFSTADYFEIDSERMKTLDIGDTLTMDLPGANNIAAEVTRVKDTISGNRVITANIPGQAHGAGAVITLGDSVVYGKIYTDGGTFVMQGNNGMAWITDANSLIQNHKEFMPTPPVNTPADQEPSPEAAALDAASKQN
ncbi:MAG: hypothetical protein AAGB12_06110 [Pseudomonadota bacterium]